MQLRVWCYVGLWCCVGMGTVWAQPLPQYSARQQGRIAELRQELDSHFRDNYARAVRLAQQLSYPLQLWSRAGRSAELAGLDDNGQLLYVGSHSNAQAANTTRTSALYAGGSLGLSLSGSSDAVRNRLGLWEVGGIPRTTHLEFGGRINAIDSPQAGDDLVHATHVAGTLIAAGRNPAARGMANGAGIQAYTSTSDIAEMTSAAPNLLISNHSYGYFAGWRFNSDRSGSIQWEWWGDTTISQTDDYKFGFYDSRARAWDQIANNAPHYLIVTSAGNNHGSNGPGPGQPYYLGPSNNTSTVPRSSQNGYEQITSIQLAKNTLTVGAISALATGYNQPSDVSLAGFSSWGSTDDGRIKPDLVGVGVNVLSTSSSSDSAYAVLSGTSMASPNVAGSLLLLQELYAQRTNGQFMRSATLKGLAIHTADEAGAAPGPDYRYGWGLLNIERAGRALLNTDQNSLVGERILSQGETYTTTVVASGRGPLVATIAWNDPAATPSAPALNDRTPKLINDLDLRVSDGSATSQPWTLDPANPANPATPGDNIRDNVEQVLVANPVPGRSYTINVTHKATLSGGRQDYALLLSGIGGQTYCASGATSDADTRIGRVQFGSINQAGSSGCTTYTDYTAVRTAVQPGQSVPLTVSLGSCGAVRNAVVRAFADWNQNGRFDDAGELLATSDVLANNQTFTTNVAVPATAQNGQLIRLRIVAVETTDPATVSACGSYAKGETQDYVLNIVQVANDVGPTALLQPEADFCGLTNSELTLTVRVRNYGSATQQNVPVSVRIADADGRTITGLSGTLATLAAFREGTLTLRTPPVTLPPGQTFRFQVTTSLPGDQNPANNSLTDTRTTAPAPVGLFSAARCGSDTLVAVRNTGSGTAFWYDAPTGGNLLALGNQTSIRLPGNVPVYASLNEFSGSFGPVSKSVFGGGSYAGNFGPAPLISTTVPLLIERARLYIAAAGQLTFTVQRLDGTSVSTVTLNVTPTRNPSLTATTSNGMLVDDPNDPGADYALYLRLPTAGDYKIVIDYAGGASLFRSNVGVTGFPYRLTAQNGQTIVSSRGSLFNNSGRVDTLTNAWYYLYDIRVRSLSCPSSGRTAVTPISTTAPVATLTPLGPTTICQGAAVTLQATTGDNLTYGWFRDGVVVAGAASSTLPAMLSGNYTVRIGGNCAPISSSAVTVTVRSAQTPVVVANGFVLTSNATTNIQWLRDGIAITGATGSSYTVVQTGRYSVRGGVNECGESISNEVFLTVLGNEPTATDDGLSVFPNPAGQQITVRLTNVTVRSPTVRLTDVRGLTVQTAPLQRDGKTYSAVLDISALTGGTFFVVIDEAQARNVRVKRIRKQ